MDLKNLKAGRSTQVTVEDATFTVTKVEGGYTLTTEAGDTAGLSYDKDAKAWRVIVDQVAVELTGATAKTAVMAAIDTWGHLTSVEAEAEMAAENTEATAQPADGNDTLDYLINTTGGHAPHRVTALGAVAVAMGGEVGFTPESAEENATLHVLAPVDVIQALELMLPMVEERMEKAAAVLSRAVSSQARARGKHHSLYGCHARRGYLLGFGLGFARKLANAEVETPKLISVTAYDEAAFTSGYEAAVGELVSA